MFALSEQRVPIWTLFRSDDNEGFNEWKSYSVPIPNANKSLYIAFTAVIGQPFVSDVILDDVVVSCSDSTSDNGKNTSLIRLGDA